MHYIDDDDDDDNDMMIKAASYQHFIYQQALYVYVKSQLYTEGNIQFNNCAQRDFG